MPNLWTTTLVVLAFFFAYYVYEPPYRGLYPDLLPESSTGARRASSTSCAASRSGSRSSAAASCSRCGTPAPFLLAAFVTTAACGAASSSSQEEAAHGARLRGRRARYLATSWCILREEPDVRRFLLANAAWEGDVRGGAHVRRPLHHDGLGQSIGDRRRRVLGAVAAGYVVAARLRGPARRPLRARPRDLLRLVRLRRRLPRRRARPAWHDWYYGAHLPGRGRGRRP